jgi:tetratricopeptide (TPR) repeat protein
VAVIDSGIDTNHPQLRHLVVKQKDFTGEGLQDELGHGTRVALAAAYGTETRDKLAPSILSAKVAHRTGKIYKTNVMEAIKWAIAEDVDIINLSLAFTGVEKEFKDLCNLIKKLEAVLFVVAAGNYGPDVQVYPAYCKCKNILSSGESVQGKPAPSSGKGAVYAPGTARFLSSEEHRFRSALNEIENGSISNAVVRILELAKENYAPARLQLGLMCFQLDEYDLALKEFKGVTPIDDSQASWIALQIGYVHIQQHNLTEAERSLARLLELKPEYAEAHYALAHVYLRMKKRERALEHLTKASLLGLKAGNLPMELEFLRQRLQNPDF